MSLDNFHLLEEGSTIFAPGNSSNTLTKISFFASSIGFGFSVLALLLLIITALLFKEWRDTHKNQLLIQFMVVRCLYTFVRYVYDLRLASGTCPEKECIIYMDEVMMIYSEVVLVAWMFVFSNQMYQSLVVILNPKTPNIWLVSITAWAAPMLVTAVMHACFKWQTGTDILVYFLYLAIIKWPILIANAVILIKILKSLRSKNVINGIKIDNTRLVVTMTFLLWSFCFQQVFVDVYKLIYVTFLNIPSFLLLMIHVGTMYHCAFCVMFWVFGNARTRKLWRNKFCGVKKVPLSPQSSFDTTK